MVQKGPDLRLARRVKVIVMRPIMRLRPYAKLTYYRRGEEKPCHPAAVQIDFYQAIKTRRHSFDTHDIARLFNGVSEARINRLGNELGQYISTNLPQR